jgi:FlaA1/EpsC-like NDP-sugar epimerase
MNYNRDSIKPKTNGNDKQIGDLELVYGTITSIQRGQKGSIIIKWEHLSTKGEVTHDFSVDKKQYRNCYRDLEVGKTFIIVQELVRQRPVRWVWTKCLEVDLVEARLIMSRCGYVNIDLQLFGDMMDVLREKRKRLEEAQKKQSLEDLLVIW